MSYEVNVHELFWVDIAKTRIYYESVSFDVADDFDRVFDDAYKNLQRNPKAYFNLSKSVRRIQLHHFPYQIIYSFKENRIYTLCLHHAESDKKEWKKRSKRK